MRRANDNDTQGEVRRRASRTGFAVAMCVCTLTLSIVPAIAATHNFIAVLNFGQEVNPPAGMMSSSFGNAFLTFDPATKMLCYSISYSALTSDEIAAHFHGPASPGENAGVLFSINTPGGPSDATSPKTGCVGPLGPRARSALNRGQIYINVHSAQIPSGEIRGQVVPVGGN